MQCRKSERDRRVGRGIRVFDGAEDEGRCWESQTGRSEISYDGSEQVGDDHCTVLRISYYVIGCL